MNVYLVKRLDRYSWDEDYAKVIIAEDTLHAERRARWDSEDFKKAKLKVEKVDLSIEQVVLRI